MNLFSTIYNLTSYAQDNLDEVNLKSEDNEKYESNNLQNYPILMFSYYCFQ